VSNGWEGRTMREFKSIIEKYEPLAGSTISESIKKAEQRAKEEGCIVLMRFNGVDIFVERGSDAGFLESYYSYRLHVHKYENALRD
jgi:hypothetical protein